MQETHCSENDESEWKQEWDGYVYFSNGTTLARGVMILVKPGTDIVIHRIETDSDGRIIYIEACILNITFKFCNLYAPNSDAQQKDFW